MTMHDAAPLISLPFTLSIRPKEHFPLWYQTRFHHEYVVITMSMTWRIRNPANEASRERESEADVSSSKSLSAKKIERRTNGGDHLISPLNPAGCLLRSWLNPRRREKCAFPCHVKEKNRNIGLGSSICDFLDSWFSPPVQIWRCALFGAYKLFCHDLKESGRWLHGRGERITNRAHLCSFDHTFKVYSYREILARHFLEIAISSCDEICVGYVRVCVVRDSAPQRNANLEFRADYVDGWCVRALD